MRVFVLAADADRGAVIGADFDGDVVVLSTLAQTDGLLMAKGDVIVVDNPGFWQAPEWAYIVHNVRVANAAAGNAWLPRFT